MALLLSILCNTIIGIVFKFYPKFKIDTQQAIVYNYIVCLALGVFIFDVNPIEAIQVASWRYIALFLGLLFITGFYFLGKTVAYHGVAVTTVTQKMSLLLSVSCSIVLYQESLGFLKVIGIVMAIVALVLVTGITSKKKVALKGMGLFLLVYTFFVSGLIETLLQYVEKVMASESGDPAFVSTLFGIAGSFGLVWLVVRLMSKQTKLSMKNILAGICLGVPNFGSIYFLMRALGQGEGSVVFPINNVSIIALTSLIGVFFFKESLTKMNWVGIILGIVSILVISS